MNSDPGSINAASLSRGVNWPLFLNRGFCLNEMPQNIPPKLRRYRNYICGR